MTLPLDPKRSLVWWKQLPIMVSLANCVNVLHFRFELSHHRFQETHSQHTQHIFCLISRTVFFFWGLSLWLSMLWQQTSAAWTRQQDSAASSKSQEEGHNGLDNGTCPFQPWGVELTSCFKLQLQGFTKSDRVKTCVILFVSSIGEKILSTNGQNAAYFWMTESMTWKRGTNIRIILRCVGSICNEEDCLNKTVWIWMILFSSWSYE